MAEVITGPPESRPGIGSPGPSLVLNREDLPSSRTGESAPSGATLRIAVLAGQTIDVAGFGLGDFWPLIVGPDLFLVGQDGNIVVLQGFMALAATENPPALLLEGGVTVPGRSVVARAQEDDAARLTTDPAEDGQAAPSQAVASGGVGQRQPAPAKVLDRVEEEFAKRGTLEAERDPVEASRPPPSAPASIVPVKESLASPGAGAAAAAGPDPPGGGGSSPSLGGAAVAFTLDTATATPFASYTVQHPNGGANVTLTVTLDDAAEGVFTPASLAASGFTDLGGGVYTLTDTAVNGETAIRQLVFDPTDDLAALGGTRATTFTVDADDGSPPVVSDNATTVTATRATGTGGGDNVTLPFGVTSGTVNLLAGADTLTLADSANVLTVTNTETINGGSAGDTVTLGSGGIVAISGVETLIGSTGGDTVNTDAAGLGTLDSLAGGLGADTLALSSAGSYDLSALAGFSGFESLTTTGNTTLTLNDAGGIVVTLANASNTVTGGSGADSVTGGSGSDTLSGAGGVDSLSGGDGTDILDGGAGADRLEGGRGYDQLTGGADADRFIFTLADSQGAIAFADVILDYEDGTDLLDVSGIADFDGMNGSDFGDLTLTELINAGGLNDGAVDTVVTDSTTGLVLLVLDSVSAGAGHTIDAADFVVSA